MKLSASVTCAVDRRPRPRTSHQPRRPACLRQGARAGAEPVRLSIQPYDVIILDDGFCTRNQGRLDRRTGVSHPTGRTAAIVRAGLPAVTIWAGAGTRAVMADYA